MERELKTEIITARVSETTLQNLEKYRKKISKRAGYPVRLSALIAHIIKKKVKKT
jgi:hypothetical protein